MSTKKPTAAAAPQAENDFTGDEFWGRGGRYVVDPATGKRSPAPAIEEPPAVEPAPEPAPGDHTADAYWGKGGTYVVDVATGKRAPAPAAADAAASDAAQIPAQTGERPDDSEPGVQIDGQGLAPAAG